MFMPTKLVLAPQPGPQTAFLQSRAEIVIGGGGAGGGKTASLLMSPIPGFGIRGFTGIIFRREYPQIKAPGGLWDKSRDWYLGRGGVPREGGGLDWRFASGAKIVFSHMQREEDRFSWDGSEFAFIGFDQLESFTETQFFYMFARNRSTCGVTPHIRVTCNPDPDHFLRKLLDWWIDPETGFAIPERSGVVRWFANVGNDRVWGESKQAIQAEHGPECEPKSITFIPSNVYDNPALLSKNPGYLATLKGMQLVDRERLLKGNWNIRYAAGMFFKRQWFEIVDAAPADLQMVRYWDRAGTEGPSDAESSKGSRTAGIKIGKASNGMYYVLDSIVFRGSPATVETSIKNTASQDGQRVRIGIEQDPGQAGKAEAGYQVRNLAGYVAETNAVHESKGTRAKPFSAQCEQGNVKIVRGAWNDGYLKELENFDGSGKCMADQVDASSGAFMFLTNKKPAGTWGR